MTGVNGKRYRAGLYMRLSKDDERAGESVSIENQRLLLTEYAEAQGWEIEDTYVDDGWSGTNFDRPGFKRMMRDAEEKRVNLILVKDMSRLGRNHIEVGRLTDYILPALNVRFVAVNDRVDSLLGDDDMTAYRNLFNEFLSKDTSRKVRAVKRSCMERGKYLGTYAPLGYKKDPADKHRLVVDEETAYIIRRVFALRCKGLGFRAIASALNDEGVPTASVIRRGNAAPRAVGLWSDSSVKSILRNEVYIGNTVQGKFTTVSYKNRKVVGKPRDQWVRVEGTHEPLVSAGQWNTAQSLTRKNYKPRAPVNGASSIFTGLLKCAGCGYNMRTSAGKVNRSDGSSYRYVSFICGNYSRSGKAACTVHTIRERALAELVLSEIREGAAACFTEDDERRIIDAALREKSRQDDARLSVYTRELKAAENRLVEIETVIQSLYEDKVRGTVGVDTFAHLMLKYERERESKTAAVIDLKNRIGEGARERDGAERWLAAVRKYTRPETLTRELLLELVDRIEVGETERAGGRRTRVMRIWYKFPNSTLP